MFSPSKVAGSSTVAPAVPLVRLPAGGAPTAADRAMPARPRTLLVVSAALPDGPRDSPGPRKDYVALARALDATVLDYTCVQRSLVARSIARLAGMPVAQAWLAFQWRRDFDAILTDGEHIGLPLALLLKLAGAEQVHVTIGHRIAAPKKQPFFRWLKLYTHCARIAIHARLQYELAVRRAGIPADRLAFVPYQVDTEFWRPAAAQPGSEQESGEAPLICSVGLEYRDYPTLFRAVHGLNVKVVVAAASHWSRRSNTANQAPLPPNVTVGAFDYHALRELYARSALVVVPLEDVDFQAGITTILEAMAMGKAVVVTHTAGQTDVVEDRRPTTRGNAPRRRPVSLLRTLAEQEGLSLEPNGIYVPPRDPLMLRQAISYLLEHPQERARLGAAGRRLVERLLTVDQYAARLRALVMEAYGERRGRGVSDRSLTVPLGA
ncbi:MAG TPA: glycosyltransferase family 4 protein [Chloroflexota bacterium]|nr:glycosyltransferase family 4 protein [Chloroflexota bacterium]